MVEIVKKISNDSETQTHEDSWYHAEILVRIILRVIVSFGLLVGGLILLAMRLAGWSVIFGLPMIVFGSVFIIYTYDEVLSKKLQPHNKLKGSDDERDDF